MNITFMQAVKIGLGFTIGAVLATPVLFILVFFFSGFVSVLIGGLR